MKWFRLYDDMVFNAKAQALPPKLFKHWINLLCIASKNDPRGRLPSVDRIAFALRMKAGSVSAILQALSGRGLIDELNLIHDWSATQYASDDSAIRKAHSRNNKIGENVTGQSRDKTASDTDTEQIQKGTPIVPVNGDGVGERFETFWKAYPRKTGKAAALKIWKRLKPGSELVVKILATLTIQKQTEQWRKDRGQFIPNPSTWLHQGRWDDEPSEPATTEKVWQPHEYL